MVRRQLRRGFLGRPRNGGRIVPTGQDAVLFSEESCSAPGDRGRLTNEKKSWGNYPGVADSDVGLSAYLGDGFARRFASRSNLELAGVCGVFRLLVPGGFALSDIAVVAFTRGSRRFDVQLLCLGDWC